ncbi:Asp23/Gls24 family envelope stress response protein [Cellulomonas fimi]|uniref:Asp23/Gls24 family envelope stress response protein n=1 Tax=Cellulomonas fimi TaxID=1708 RepID=A0A7Y0LY68_CELFI|nr:Asp23/Gls24 family envelope stress response protein [Cellulomonas fimi]NMR20091.1 Asp23/Gls24 family envelope stress response protein [Cellulomonas fimi]
MGSTRLPCGADYDDLLTQVADHAPPADSGHQSTCPHCRAALAQLTELWAPVDHLAAEEVRTPESVLRAVMARVRELTEHTWFAFVPTDRGHTRIAARVIAAVARLAAEEIPHVALALGSGRTSPYSSPAHIAGPETDAATDVGVAGSHVVVDIQVAIEMGANIPDIADRVRAHITGVIATQLDLTAAEVNVTVADVQPVGRPRSG